MDEERDPAVSVIIPCFNEETRLPIQLGALARQRPGVPFEVVIADNGSTDDSVAVARSFADRLPLHVVDASGVQGPSHATNVGVAHSRGPVLAFCDADDEVADDWLMQMVAALEQDRFVAGRVDLERLNDATTRRSRRMAQEHGLQTSPVLHDLPHAGAGNMGIHRDVFEAVGGFDENLRCLQDTDFCWRVQMTWVPLRFHPEVLLHTRFRSTWRDTLSQGYAYGQAFAQLAHRYAGREPAVAGGGQVGAPRPGRLTALRQKASRTARQAADTWRSQGARGVVWTAAWHAGYQSGRRAADPSPSRSTP